MIHPRKTLASATLLTAAAATLGTWGWGADAGLGVLLGGAVAVLDFWLLSRNVGAQVQLLQAGGRRPSLWLGASILRFAAVLGLLWFALLQASPMGVLVGLACVVAAVTLRAFVALVSPEPIATMEP